MNVLSFLIFVNNGYTLLFLSISNVNLTMTFANISTFCESIPVFHVLLEQKLLVVLVSLETSLCTVVLLFSKYAPVPFILYNWFCIHQNEITKMSYELPTNLSMVNKNIFINVSRLSILKKWCWFKLLNSVIYRHHHFS